MKPMKKRESLAFLTPLNAIQNNFDKNLSGTFKSSWRRSVLKEVVRKSIHASSAFTVLALQLFGKGATLVALFTALFLYLVSEILRVKGFFVPFVAQVTQAASRARDEGKIVLGPIALVLGIAATIICFSTEVATLGIFALSFGDGLASLIGKLFGHNYIPFSKGKSAEGSLACFLGSFIALYAASTCVSVSFILAVIAMTVELLPLMDADNIAIPLCVSFAAKALLLV